MSLAFTIAFKAFGLAVIAALFAFEVAMPNWLMAWLFSMLAISEAMQAFNALPADK